MSSKALPCAQHSGTVLGFDGSDLQSSRVNTGQRPYTFRVPALDLLILPEHALKTAEMPAMPARGLLSCLVYSYHKVV